MFERMRSHLTQQLQEIREAGLEKPERVIGSPQGATVAVMDRQVLNLCANNYLGLADHPEVVAAAKEALDRWGYGMASVRFICGTQEVHKELEQALTEFLGTEDTILYSSCFDSHGGGFIGANGRGTHEHHGVMGRIDAISGTLGKALGGASGGYVSGRKELVAMLRQRSRPYLFSNSVAPPIVAGSLKVLELLRNAKELRQRLADNTKLFRGRMTEEEFEILPGDHPIVPVMVGDASLAGRMAAAMLEKGVYVVGFSYPAVPQGKARLRTQVSAAHSRGALEMAVRAFIETRAEVSR